MAGKAGDGLTVPSVVVKRRGNARGMACMRCDKTAEVKREVVEDGEAEWGARNEVW